MSASRLFWKLFLTYAAISVIGTVALVIVLTRWYREQLVAQAENRLRDAAIVLREQLDPQLLHGQSVGLQDLVDRIARATLLRIVILSPNGKVLASSDRDSAAVKSESPNSPASPAAGAALAQPMLTQSQRVMRGNQQMAIVWTALPISSIDDAAASLRWMAWWVGGSMNLLVLALTWWLVARVVRPVTALNETARRIAEGDYAQRIYVPNRDELGDLGVSFNRMGQQMSGHVGQLRESSQRLETVLRGMIEGVIAVDDRQRVLFANDAAGRLLDFTPADAVGRSLLESVRHVALHQAALEALASKPTIAGATAADGRRIERRRLEITLDKSPSRVLSTHVARLPGVPCPGVVLVLDDVTELRRLENLRRDFVANVSHELKTPLSSIKAYAETLRGGALEDPEIRGEFVQRIDEQADRLHQLIQDLLSLARIESGADIHHISAVPLMEAVTECVVHHAAAAATKGIRLSPPAADEPISVAADPEGLREILNNLLDNALKYTPKGGHVMVRIRRDGDREEVEANDGVSQGGQGNHGGSGFALLEVEDTGIGIAAEDQPRVFERFYRVDRARSRELGGTGLGLSIVKHLAQSFGGSVSLTSTPGQGSTFSVRLRLAEK